MRILAVVTLLAVAAIHRSNLQFWEYIAALGYTAGVFYLELQQLGRIPISLVRMPNGLWLGYSASRYPPIDKKISTKYVLERHFFAGNWSIYLLFKDRVGKNIAVCLMKSACSDSEWRRLRVLLRWSDAGSSQVV